VIAHGLPIYVALEPVDMRLGSERRPRNWPHPSPRSRFLRSNPPRRRRRPRARPPSSVAHPLAHTRGPCHVGSAQRLRFAARSRDLAFAACDSSTQSPTDGGSAGRGGTAGRGTAGTVGPGRVSGAGGGFRIAIGHRRSPVPHGVATDASGIQRGVLSHTCASWFP
jgi:hypothetical protein